MQEVRLMRRPEVESVSGCSCSTIYELMAKGEFPKNITIHGRAKGWISSQVFQWVSERVEEAKKQQAEAEEAKKQLQANAEEEEQDKSPEQQDEEEEAEEIAK